MDEATGRRVSVERNLGKKRKYGSYPIGRKANGMKAMICFEIFTGRTRIVRE